MESSPRRLAAVCGGALALACCLSFSFVGAFHQPSPHGVPLAVVAPPAAAAGLESAVAARAPGALSVRIYSSAAAAIGAVRDRAADGALVVGRSGMRLVVAGAGGFAPEQFLTSTFQSVSAAMRQPLDVSDVVPLPAADSQGLSAFFVTLTVLIPSLVAGIALALAGRRARPLVHAGWLAGFCVLTGLAAALVADPVFGALTGHFFALAGIMILFSLAVAIPTAGLARVLPPLAAVPLLLFLVIGIPASGGPAGMALFMPGFFRWFASWLPVSRALSAITGSVYFAGHGVGADLWILAAWAAAGLVLILATASRRAAPAGANGVAAQRQPLPGPAQPATSGS